ncbi:techylectin-5A-like [Centruroides sculpturatus]|uniref:techylectin-5A-like n=1 Tax=Centruroides sculpturatus TaxID=218467 RepID=UPI000C6CA9C3|nr:techylectin-5A-like [Centruroides sculpturatus]
MLFLQFLLLYLSLDFKKNSVYCSSCNNQIMSQFLKFTENILDQASDLIKQSNSFQLGPIDCAQIMKNNNVKSGIYRIWPLAWEKVGSFSVYCDMDTDGGGWTHRNDRIHAISNQGNYSLRINMKDLENEKRYAIYKNFWLDNEDHSYKIHISSYSGDSGDSLTVANGMKFTTQDKDNDVWSSNCAVTYKGAWWYKDCHRSNLNGLNLNGPHESYADGIEWYSWKEHHYSLPEIEMKIRPVNFK